MENKDQPVFPVMMQHIGDCEYRASKPNDPKEYNTPMAGITKREYFAAMALQGLLANPALSVDDPVKTAIFYADDLLKELSTPQP